MSLTSLADQACELLAACEADEWEVMALASDSLSMAVRGRELDKFQQASSLGLSLRVALGGKLGFSYVMGESAEALKQAVQSALASARESDLTQEVGFAAPGAELAECDVFDPQLAQELVEAKKQRALDMAVAALEADPKIVHVHPAEVGEGVSHLTLRTSHGLELEHRGTFISAGVVAMAGNGEEQEVAYDGEAVRFASKLDPVELGARTGRRAAAYLGGAPMPDGRYDVVLENAVAAELLGLLASSLLGDNLLKGRSLFKDKLGEEIISPALTIVDDGLYPQGLGTAPFDDEGTPQRRTVLFEDGVLKNFVYDRLWGAEAGAASTGNAVRGSLKAPPGVGFTNLHLVPGQGSMEDLAGQVSKGMLITEIMGAHTADPVSGEFSLGAAGFLLENGRIGRPVKSMAVAGQVVDLFKAIKVVGDDLRFFGRSGSPSLLVAGLSLSGPSA